MSRARYMLLVSTATVASCTRWDRAETPTDLMTESHVNPQDSGEHGNVVDASEAVVVDVGAPNAEPVVDVGTPNAEPSTDAMSPDEQVDSADEPSRVSGDTETSDALLATDVSEEEQVNPVDAIDASAEVIADAAPILPCEAGAMSVTSAMFGGEFPVCAPMWEACASYPTPRSMPDYQAFWAEPNDAGQCAPGYVTMLSNPSIAPDGGDPLPAECKNPCQAASFGGLWAYPKCHEDCAGYLAAGIACCSVFIPCYGCPPPRLDLLA